MTSWPRAIEMRLIALAMLSTAIRTKPSATASAVIPALVRNLCAQRPRSLGVDRLVAAGAEDPGEMLRPDLAEDDVAVGDGERPAAAVAGRAGNRPGAVRPDPEAGAVIMADRAAAGRDGVDLEHRRPHPHPGDDRLVGSLVGAGMMRDVGRGAAHVEADHPVEPGLRGGLRHSDDSAGRTGQDRVLALEGAGVGEAARRLHEEEARLGSQRGDDPVDVASQHRRQIGVDHGRVAAPDQLDQRPDPVADRDLGEADLLRQRGERRFVRGPAPAVHQDDRDRAIASLISAYKGGTGGLQVERAKHLALGRHPFVYLDDVVVERFGKDDAACEDVGPRLVADPQRVAEAAADGEDEPLALALEQGVGGDGGAHLHRVERRLAMLGKQPTDAFDGGVVILLRIVGKELRGSAACRPGPGRRCR